MTLTSEFILNTERHAHTGADAARISYDDLDNLPAGNNATYVAGTDLNLKDAVFIYTDGKIYPASGATATLANTFIGFIEKEAAKDANAEVILAGRSTNHTSLTTGSAYYLSDHSTIASVEHTGTTGSKSMGSGESAYQTFTSESSRRRIISCRVNFSGLAGTPGMRMRIREGSGLGGTLIADSGSYTTIASGWNTISFNIPVQLKASTTYSLTYDWDGANSFSVAGAAGNPYANGQWHSDSDFDAAFTIFRESGLFGSIGTSAGSVSKKVGVAMSSTELQIIPS